MFATRISLLISIAAVVLLGAATAHVAKNVEHREEANDALFSESGEVGVSQCSMQVRPMHQKPQSSCGMDELDRHNFWQIRTVDKLLLPIHLTRAFSTTSMQRSACGFERLSG